MLRGFAKVAQRAAKAECQLGSLFNAAASQASAFGSNLPVAAESAGKSIWSRADARCSLLGNRSFHSSQPSSSAQAEPVDNGGENPIAGKKTDKEVPNDGKVEELGYMMSYPKYDKEYLESVKPKHKPPKELYQKTALLAVGMMRKGFDVVTGYPNKMDECKWLQRFVFLETVAGVPGMVGGMLRHMKSLRTMSRDHGWIHTLLEEAENERMHLLTFMQLKQPGPFFRGFVLLTQGIFFNLYTLFYLISPKHCHAFVGYLEEEAVRTYTHALQEIDAGALPDWKTLKPPEIGRTYWGLGKDATMRDLILAVRADEYGHSHVNHTFSVLKQSDDNPFEKGAHQVP